MTALLSSVFATNAAFGQARTPPQGAALLKTDILYVCAHPDDETGVAATLARYSLGRGMVTASVYCTRGEGGGNMVGTQAGPALGLLREVELRDALRQIGVRYVFFLDQVDWAYTESRAATERKWDREGALRNLVRLYRALRPDVILTMNPAPVPGQHGHHQTAGVLATEAFEAAANPARFPEQLTREGLTTWQPRKLYYNNWGGGGTIQIPTTDKLPDGRDFATVAAQAMSHHRSQAFGAFADSPFLRRPQSFTLVKSVVPVAEKETDLLQGVPGRDPNAPPILLSFQPESYHVAPGQPFMVNYRVTQLGRVEAPLGVTLRVPEGWQTGSVEPQIGSSDETILIGQFRVTAPESAVGKHERLTGVVTLGEKEITTAIPVAVVAPLTMRFIPRPAIARYLEWSRAQGTEHVAAQIPVDLPCVAGEPNPIMLEIRNHSATPTEGRVRLHAPAGWQVAGTLAYRLSPGGTARLTAQVTPPAEVSADVELKAMTEMNGMSVSAAARAHPVPRMKVTRVDRALPLDGTGKGWENIPAQRILPAMRAEGEAKSEADSSGTFRIAHDGKTLYVDIDVMDDAIVSNIAPNDIKGHWRSDSVEICLDPQAGAEDTLGCFKVGIFPFDTTGRVRAARDADANQGPVEETAPTMRLVSARTPTGYRIQAAIPFEEINVTPTRGKRLGFNLILYDGDKKDAAPGENINESRLAWAPRPGVMGRPEDWGRIELE